MAPIWAGGWGERPLGPIERDYTTWNGTEPKERNQDLVSTVEHTTLGEDTYSLARKASENLPGEVPSSKSMCRAEGRPRKLQMSSNLVAREAVERSTAWNGFEQQCAGTCIQYV